MSHPDEKSGNAASDEKDSIPELARQRRIRVQRIISSTGPLSREMEAPLWIGTEGDSALIPAQIQMLTAY